MRAGIPKESRRAEQRVAATPETVAGLIKLGFEVLVEHGAGEAARCSDAAYAEAGAVLVGTDTLWESSDLILKVAHPQSKELKLLREGTTLACVFDADEHDPLVGRLQAKGCTLIALDAVPRISRAQVMDIRSSMANLAGYRAVLEAASHFGRTMGPQVTAAGSTPPAKVLIIGAGVAGLAAVAAARGMGAVVRAFDTRAAAREQVESLGGEFLEVEIEEDGEGGGGYAKVMSEAFIAAEMALFRAQAAEVDVVITTALIPGRPAPKLWLADMVEVMRPGSVVVDLAASRGGNCELTVPGKVVDHRGVTIVGETDLTQRMADHASRLLARNILALVKEFGGAEGWRIDRDNDVVRCVTVVEQGELRWPAPPPEPTPPPAPAAKEVRAEVRPPPPRPVAHAEEPPSSPPWVAVAVALVVVPLGFIIAPYAPDEFLDHVKIFILSCFIGWQVIWNVSPALHTPLMAVTNAISGIIIIGGMLQIASNSAAAAVLGFAAILFASINVFGGFGVTHRMLGMFRREVA
jgi:NAD(P) transhydrogenase subunit alpha